MKNLLAGFAGAVALNILHETLKKTAIESPRVDLLGEEALQKAVNYFGKHISDQKTLYQATLAGDIVSNTLYYSMIGRVSPKNRWPVALGLGLSAGIGAIKLAEPLGLDSSTVAKNNQLKILTVGYYLLGAVVAALVLGANERR